MASNNMAVVFDQTKPKRTAPKVHQFWGDRTLEAFESGDYDAETAPDEFMVYPMSRRALESNLNGRPVFTRALLQNVANLCQEARSQYVLSANDNTGTSRVVWRAPSGGPKADMVVCVDFLTTIEQHPEFKPTKRSGNQDLLRSYNYKMPQDSRNPDIRIPMVLSSYIAPPNAKRVTTDYMTRSRLELKRIDGMWRASSSFARLVSTFREASKSSTRIKKIVCMGLGSLDLNKGNDQSALQHMAVITIAKTLNEAYAADDHQPIRIICQDPNYRAHDKYLWPMGYNHFDFVDNPDGFLHIDENTLVVTAFLPVGVPLMQICADICRESGGPAGFICDKVDLNPRKQTYMMADRLNPQVAKMLQGYDSCGFEDHEIEEEMHTEVLNGYSYWLWAMDLHLKPDGGWKKV
jgi:hypothetical protein